MLADHPAAVLVCAAEIVTFSASKQCIQFHAEVYNVCKPLETEFYKHLGISGCSFPSTLICHPPRKVLGHGILPRPFGSFLGAHFLSFGAILRVKNQLGPNMHSRKDIVQLEFSLPPPPLPLGRGTSTRFATRCRLEVESPNRSLLSQGWFPDTPSLKSRPGCSCGRKNRSGFNGDTWRLSTQILYIHTVAYPRMGYGLHIEYISNQAGWFYFNALLVCYGRII